MTPALRQAIEDEIEKMDLGHIPFRVDEATERGKSLFDVTLAARQDAAKARVLSEGEQRALGIACFLAEVGRVPGRNGIIVDDPVSSLDHLRMQRVAGRLVEEAASGRQVIIFTHNLIFYQEVLAAAAAKNPQVPAIVNLISKAGGEFGLVSENDEPWIAKKVKVRIEVLRRRLEEFGTLPEESESFRRLAKDFFTDLRETWERLVEEVLLGGVVERFNAGVKTQSLSQVQVEDSDYQAVYTNMARVSEFSGHDRAAGRQVAAPTLGDMREALETLARYRGQLHSRNVRLAETRRALQGPPTAQLQ